MLLIKEYSNGYCLNLDGVDVSSSVDVEWFKERVLPHPTGSILFGGLGLGADIIYCLSSLEVTNITVVEISQEIIDWFRVNNHQAWMDPRLTILQGDFYEYTKDDFDIIVDSTGDDYLIY